MAAAAPALTAADQQVHFMTVHEVTVRGKSTGYLVADNYFPTVNEGSDRFESKITWKKHGSYLDRQRAIEAARATNKLFFIQGEEGPTEFYAPVAVAVGRDSYNMGKVNVNQSTITISEYDVPSDMETVMTAIRIVAEFHELPIGYPGKVS